MTRFQDVTYNQTAQAATIGAGLIWDDVYAALEPYAVNVVGGRVSGVGVAGLILGGGVFLGLVVDIVFSPTSVSWRAYELVLPNGTVIDVTQSSSPDLFFALKGGFNNFGIVTRFTLMTVPQGQVWGGPIMYSEAVVEQVTAATADFSANCTDPKAQLITTYNYLAGLPVISELLFYDGPSPPAGVFDKFLAIPSLSEDVSTRSFLSLVRSYPGNETTGLRSASGVFNSVSVTGFPEELLDLVLEEAVYWSTSLLPLAGLFVSYDVEPFLPTIFTHNSTPSAYPGSRERAVFPINIYFAWALALDDDAIQNATRISAERLYNKAVELGQPIEGAPLYPNYALSDEPLEDMYGDNVEALKRIKDSVDPDNVMGLAGGFKF
ncbi:hypothetical protein ID866_3586 [Astraeus odoratus]|nr:hypothetical protein ID866_3586 [Astraeus odoratus]